MELAPLWFMILALRMRITPICGCNHYEHEDERRLKAKWKQSVGYCSKIRNPFRPTYYITLNDNSSVTWDDNLGPFIGLIRCLTEPPLSLFFNLICFNFSFNHWTWNLGLTSCSEGRILRSSSVRWIDWIIIFSNFWNAIRSKIFSTSLWLLCPPDRYLISIKFPECWW